MNLPNLPASELPSQVEEHGAARRRLLSARALEDKVILVTGGAGGLGAALCTAIAEHDGIALVADLWTDKAEALVRELQQRGLRARALSLDVGDTESVAACLDAVHAEFGRLDAVINNAGIDFTVALPELGIAQWEAVLRTNLHGPFLLAKLALPMLQASQGQIINIASTAAKRAWPNAAAYHASKWGLLGLSHALHAELRVLGIKVSAVIAGGMRTPFLLERFPDLDPDLLQAPEHVATAVIFALCAPPGTVIPELTVLPMRESSWP